MIAKPEPFLQIEYRPTKTNAGWDILADLLISGMVSLQHTEEVIEGSGGTLAHLGNLIIVFIIRSPTIYDYDEEDEDIPDDAGGSRLGTAIFDFIDSIDTALSSKKLGSFELGPLGTMLATHVGPVTALAATAGELGRDAIEHLAFSPVLGGCLALLNSILIFEPRHTPVQDSLDFMVPLIHSVFRCGPTGKFQQPLMFMLEKVPCRCATERLIDTKFQL
ncbi:hypothetical protein B0H19DRAFT_1272168 [Mycena capillaripes]|nr:hypothetical protein B0H19DRAFT_1272168 [Mycena capillaripes]